MERDRRLDVNATGRMTDGTLSETMDPRNDPQDGTQNTLLVFYRYSVAGVEYSAAQNLFDLRHVVNPRTYFPGEAVTIKYNSQNPSNSIVVCEEWNGLHGSVEFSPKRRDLQLSAAKSGNGNGRVAG